MSWKQRGKIVSSATSLLHKFPLVGMIFFANLQMKFLTLGKWIDQIFFQILPREGDEYSGSWDTFVISHYSEDGRQILVKTQFFSTGHTH